MKIIDVLNKIANGEEVRFKINGNTYHCYKYSNLYNEDLKEDVEWYLDEEWLNKEVEIIEEDKKIEKIEKIDMFDYFTGYDFDGTSKDLLKHLERNFEKTNEKFNEIIDCINKENK